MVVETTDEKIRKQQFKFLADNGLSVYTNALVTNAKSTIYTVPADKVFYITTISLYYLQRDAAINNCSLIVKTVGLLRMRSAGVVHKQETMTLSFPIPIKLVEGEIIEVESSAVNVQVVGGFTGYEFDA